MLTDGLFGVWTGKEFQLEFFAFYMNVLTYLIHPVLFFSLPFALCSWKTGCSLVLWRFCCLVWISGFGHFYWSWISFAHYCIWKEEIGILSDSATVIFLFFLTRAERRQLKQSCGFQRMDSESLMRKQRLDAPNFETIIDETKYIIWYDVWSYNTAYNTVTISSSAGCWGLHTCLVQLKDVY